MPSQYGLLDSPQQDEGKHKLQKSPWIWVSLNPNESNSRWHGMNEVWGFDKFVDWMKSSDKRPSS